jgi:hypothetical protein
MEMMGQLLHSGFTVSEYSEDSDLRDRQPVVCGDPAEYSLNHEGKLDEGVREGSGSSVGVIGPSLFDLVRDTN